MNDQPLMMNHTDEAHDGEHMDECVQALENLHSFLRHELCEMDADAIRHHLHACERCMDNFNIEEAITVMLKRCCSGAKAPDRLRASITHTITGS